MKVFAVIASSLFLLLAGCTDEPKNTQANDLNTIDLNKPDLSKPATNLENAAKDVANDATNSAKGVADSATDAAKGAVGSVKDVVGSAKDVAKDVTDSAKGLVNDATNVAKGAVNTTKDVVKGAADDIASIAKGHGINGNSMEETLIIGSELVDCIGVAPMKCMQVKRSKDADWELFYSNIDGFEFQPGFEYEVVVKKSTVINPAADASSEGWQLSEVKNKNLVKK